MEITIRKETSKDYPAVYNINSRAFGRNDEARLVDRLRAGDSFIEELSLIATSGNETVGYIMFTKISIINSAETIKSLALAPISVSPDQQQQGIGKQLIEYGLNRAKELGHKSVIVLGDPKYYHRFGFETSSKWDIKAPFNVPANVFMALELEDGALNDVQGTVVYSEEFAQI